MLFKRAKKTPEKSSSLTAFKALMLMRDPAPISRFFELTRHTAPHHLWHFLLCVVHCSSLEFVFPGWMLMCDEKRTDRFPSLPSSSAAALRQTEPAGAGASCYSVLYAANAGGRARSLLTTALAGSGSGGYHPTVKGQFNFLKAQICPKGDLHVQV